MAAFTGTVGCTPAPSGMGGLPPLSQDAGVMPPVPDAGVDRPSSLDARAVDLAAESPTDTAAGDVPRWWPQRQAWPPPGTAYLTKLETEAQYRQLLGNQAGSVPFIIRRRGNDQPYPYPWDMHECIFEPGGDSHLEFLTRLDPERGLTLYHLDTKLPESSLIPGRVSLDEIDSGMVTVLFENTRLLSADSDYPLDPAVIATLRERIRRCVSFPTSFTFLMICPGGLECHVP